MAEQLPEYHKIMLRSTAQKAVALPMWERGGLRTAARTANNGPGCPDHCQALLAHQAKGCGRHRSILLQSDLCVRMDTHVPFRACIAGNL